MENWSPSAITHALEAASSGAAGSAGRGVSGVGEPTPDPPWSAADDAWRPAGERWSNLAELVAAGCGCTGAFVAYHDADGVRVIATSAAAGVEAAGTILARGWTSSGATLRAVTDTRGSSQPLDAALAAQGFASYAMITVVLRDGRPFGMIAAVDRQRNADIQRMNTVLRASARLLEDEAAMVEALERSQATVQRLRMALADAEMARLLADRENAAKSSFLAAMSHELRTPLNAIIGFSEILKDQLFGPIGRADYVQYASDIHESGCHLISLINDVLDMAKIEANRIEIEREWLDLGEALQMGVKLVSVQARKGGLSVELEECDPDLRIFADERTLKQILFNLLSNAVKYTEPGGRATVSGFALADGGTAVVVADTGVGIAPDALKRLVRPFERVDNRFDATHQGFGLGLALVNKLVQLHGGRLEIDSAVGVGTRVTVTFPPPGVPEEVGSD